jgi:hypothetical protein
LPDFRQIAARFPTTGDADLVFRRHLLGHTEPEIESHNLPGPSSQALWRPLARNPGTCVAFPLVLPLLNGLALLPTTRRCEVRSTTRPNASATRGGGARIGSRDLARDPEADRGEAP